MDAPDLSAALRSADAAPELFSAGETVVVGVSGGPDSVALLRALLDYAPERGLSLHAAHVDHQLRPDSAADADFVRQLAAAWAVPMHVESISVPSPGVGGPEAAARALRYGALAGVAERLGARTIAVAHTANDQAETVLMNLIRGTGLAGLRGMRSVAPLLGGNEGRTDLRLVRPFLAVDRAAVLAYLSARGIAARDDASNRDPRFLRNRLRHAVLPGLAALNPRVRTALVHLADSAAEDEELLDEIAARAWSTLVDRQPDCVIIDTVALQRSPRAVQQRVLRRAARELLGDGRTFGWTAVLAIRTLLDAGPKGRSSLPGGLEAVLDDGLLRLSRQPPGRSRVPADRMPVALPLTVPGTTLLPGGWRISTELRARQPDEPVNRDPWVCRLDADALAAPLGVRGRQPGDRLVPLGMGGRHRRLQDLFVDAQVAREERDCWPLLVAEDEILWVVGLRLAEAARLRPTTRRVLELQVVPPERVAGSSRSGDLSAP
jgi:tRNA(Ile)-lysidine synthase